MTPRRQADGAGASKPPARPGKRTASAEPPAGAVPAAVLQEPFPSIELPLRPPFPPMEARAVDELPSGAGWLFEPKWDGFRCLSFRSGRDVLLQSKSAQPLARYFPEVVEALAALPPERFVLDGEIVITVEGVLSFDDLLQRIHPAESRIRRLARETPATLLVFDLLVDGGGRPLLERSLSERRAALEAFFQKLPWDAGTIRLSPATADRRVAEGWIAELAATGLDGVMAKELGAPYRSGDRSAMRKVKLMRTVDCVVGGFRYAQHGGEVGSLLLGLYDAGRLDHVGFTSSFTAVERKALKPLVEPLIRPPGFTGKAPGGPSRWSSERSGEWQPLEPRLVCEVRYDHFSGDRFRHGTKLLRWRPDKEPAACTLDQVRPVRSPAALARLGLGPAR